jgi:hypothetical protein
MQLADLENGLVFQENLFYLFSEGNLLWVRNLMVIFCENIYFRKKKPVLY